MLKKALHQPTTVKNLTSWWNIGEGNVCIWDSRMSWNYFGIYYSQVLNKLPISVVRFLGGAGYSELY